MARPVNMERRETSAERALPLPVFADKRIGGQCIANRVQPFGSSAIGMHAVSTEVDQFAPDKYFPGLILNGQFRAIFR